MIGEADDDALRRRRHIVFEGLNLKETYDTGRYLSLEADGLFSH